MVRRRHIFYIAGFDPLGIEHYHHLFRRETVRAREVWPVSVAVSEATMDEHGHAGRWHIESSGPNWQVSTTYEYLRWDDIIARHISRPMPILFVRSVLVLLEYLLNGTLLRVFRANRRFGLFYVLQPAMLTLTVTVPVAIGFWSSALLPQPWGWLTGATAAVATYFAMRALAWRWFAIQMATCWLWFRDWMHRETPECLARYDFFASRIAAKMQENDVDEVLVAGHSAGATLIVPIIARALERDPSFAKNGPQLTLLVLGSLLPLAALHPKGDAVRDAIRVVATEPSLRWIDVQLRKDPVSFCDLDMVAQLGVDLQGKPKHNPICWRIRYRDTLPPEFYDRLRWNFYRMHFQFIMSNHRRMAFDYIMMVCGPAAARDWIEANAVARFANDASYRNPSAEQAIDQWMPDAAIEPKRMGG